MCSSDLECHLTVGGQVIRTLEVDGIDRGGVSELHEIDDARRLGAHLVEVVLRHDDVAPLLELVPLDDLRVRHLAVAVRAPALLLNAGLAFAVRLVEGDRSDRLGRRNTLIGMFTRLISRKPFQVARAAIARLVSARGWRP